jgi:cell division protein ZapA (FtsZ GTPase activity inhibitor)
VSAESELAEEFEALAQHVDQRLRELKEKLERRAEELKRAAFQGSDR